MILEEITKSMEELDEERLFKLVHEYLETGPTEAKAKEIMDHCHEGTKLVGDLYSKGEYFVSDLMMSGKLLTEVIELLKPITLKDIQENIGKILLGTVRGDLHEIGKNVFKYMSEAAGFKVYDIGMDQKANDFVKKAEEIKPDIVGMSGILTLSIDSMKDTVDELVEARLRDSVKIIVGGSQLSEKACKYIGADAFAVNASVGVEICREFMSAKTESE